MGPWAILSILLLAVAGVLALLTYAIGIVPTMAICFVLICLLMMLVILIQKPKGGGLSGAFGSAGGSETAFGAKTGDVLTVVTISCFVTFILLAMGLTWSIRPVDLDETPEISAPMSESAPIEVLPAPVDLTQTPGSSDAAAPAADSGAAPTPVPGATPAPSADAAPAPTPAPAP